VTLSSVATSASRLPGDPARERLRIDTPHGELALDPAIGNLPELVFRHGGRRLVPLAAAPWADEPDTLPEGEALAPVERRLAGDFFCAPFGANDVETGPPHGWSANSRWRCTARGVGTLELVLERRIMGATIGKRLVLAHDAPLLYQTHVVDGGEDGLSVAHHPMIRSEGTARLCVSPKRAVLVVDPPLDHGRHRLAAGAHVLDPSAVPAEGGGTIDITRLPIAERHDDFVTLVESAERTIGWSAVLRDVEDDIVFFLKNPVVLPVTMLWHSNGGRDHAPWNGRHRGVLGVEDGCSAEASGHRAALADNRLTRLGVPSALALAPGRRHRVAHVTGCIARPRGWESISDISIDGPTLSLASDSGETLRLPFDATFFKERH